MREPFACIYPLNRDFLSDRFPREQCQVMCGKWRDTTSGLICHQT